MLLLIAATLAGQASRKQQQPAAARHGVQQQDGCGHCLAAGERHPLGRLMHCGVRC